MDDMVRQVQQRGREAKEKRENSFGTFSKPQGLNYMISEVKRY